MKRRCSVVLLALVFASRSAMAQGAAPDAPAPEPPVEGASPASTPAEPASSAAPADPGLEGARDAFRLGSALARQGQWNEALAAFERSQQLQPHAVTLYNIGYVERALGHYTRARKNLRMALATGANGVLPSSTARETEGYLAEIERKLARVVVNIDPDTAVAMDGRPLEAEERDHGKVFVAGTAPSGPGAVPGPVTFDLLADPGRHVIRLARAATPDTILEATFAPGATTSLELTMTRAEPEPQPAVAPAKDTPAADESVATGDGTHTTWMWVAYGVGGAGLVAGSVFGILALDKKAFLDDRCTLGTDKYKCPSQYEGDIDAMNHLALGSTIGFAVAGLGAAVGTYLLVSGGSGEKATPSGVGFSAQPWLGVGSAGVSGSF